MGQHGENQPPQFLTDLAAAADEMSDAELLIVLGTTLAALRARLGSEKLRRIVDAGIEVAEARLAGREKMAVKTINGRPIEEVRARLCERCRPLFDASIGSVADRGEVPLCPACKVVTGNPVFYMDGV